MSENEKQTKHPRLHSFKKSRTYTRHVRSIRSENVMVKVPISPILGLKLSGLELNYSPMSNREEKPLVVKCSEIKPSSSSVEKNESKDSKKLKKDSVNQVEGNETLETSITIEEFTQLIDDELTKMEEAVLKLTAKAVANKWYPYENTDTYAGKMTQFYLQALSNAIHRETEVFKFLFIAKSLHEEIDCRKTNIVWKKLNVIIPMCSQFVELIQVAHDIAFYLRYGPESLFSYLKCFERLKSYIKLTPLKEGHKLWENN